jgi:hypothetical protein
MRKVKCVAMALLALCLFVAMRAAAEGRWILSAVNCVAAVVNVVNLIFLNRVGRFM